MAKKKKLELKEYVRKTKILKDFMLQDFRSFLEKLVNFQKYPVPIYEILMSDSHTQLIEYLLDKKQLDVKLQNLKNEERKIAIGKSTEDFFYTLNENQTLFEFKLTKSNDSYQIYISKNLRNLVSLKLTLYYLNTFEAFYNELSDELKKNFKDYEVELDDLKKKLLNLKIGAYSEFLSIHFSLENEFNLKELIVDLKDIEKVKQFKFNIQNYDNTLNPKNILNDFISKHINPRIDLIINSLKEIINSKIKQLEELNSNEINVNTQPFSEYYIFMCETKKLIQHGLWLFEDLVKDEIQINKDKMDSGDISEIRNDELNKEKDSSSKKKEEEDLIKYIILFYNLNKWIQYKIQSNQKNYLTFNEYINYEFLNYNLDFLKTEFYNYVWELLIHTNNDHINLINLPNFPLIIPKEYKKIENPEDGESISEIIIRLDKVIEKLQIILNHNDFYFWFKDGKIIFSILNPWLSLINSINYLEGERPKIPDFYLPFWDKMIELFSTSKTVYTCNIADNYLKELYKKYKESKEIFKYKILINDVFKIFDTASDFQDNIFKQIEMLFDISTTAIMEEREIISNIKRGKTIDRKDQKYLDAKDRLIKKGIIKENTVNIFGVI